MSFVAISRCESANSMRYMVDIYRAKVIIAVLLDIFLFLSYSVIYSYVSFLMRLIEIIKPLILLFILFHVNVNVM